MSLTGDTVWRDHVVAGNSSSGKNKPNKAEIRAWARTIEGAANSSTVVKATLAALQAVTPDAETNGGIVLADATASNNGFYYRDAGAWVKGRGLPDSLAVLTNIGGTANAITASTEAGVNPADVQMIILPDPPGTNTSATVTIALNGGAAEDIKAASGANVAIGDIIAGVGTLFFRFGTEWRQLFSSATGATFDHQGDYDALTTYTEGQVVTGSDGNWYQLKAASATGDDPVGSVTGDWLQILAAAAIPDGSLVEAKYATGSVSTRALADGAATADKLADGAATLVKVGDDAKADFRLGYPGATLSLPLYRGATSIRLPILHGCAGGFWFRGSYQNDRGKVLPVADMVFDWTTDLAAETSVKLESWQACFYVAGPSDLSWAPKIMPYLRVHSVAGSVVTLNKAGEGIGAQDPASAYTWADDELVGAHCLVISEGGAWSDFRTTTITANTDTTVTLADIGSVGATFDGAPSLDWLLIAPPGYSPDEFFWATDFYADTAEVRNFYAGRSGVQSKMIHILDPSAALTGSVAGPPGQRFNAGGYISPLATALRADVSCVLSTASTGGFAEYFDGDGSNHIVQSKYTEKVGSGSLSIQHDAVRVPFLYHQRFNYYNAGAVAPGRINGQINITGWEY